MLDEHPPCDTLLQNNHNQHLNAKDDVCGILSEANLNRHSALGTTKARPALPASRANTQQNLTQEVIFKATHKPRGLQGVLLLEKAPT